MNNVKRKLAMFLAVVVLTGGMHVLASNSASVKSDKSAIEQEMANSELLITGNDTITYDGNPVTLNDKDGDFQYQGDGKPVWYQLQKNGTEKGQLADNYTRVRNVPTDAGEYAVTVYNQKIEAHSDPFYFQIAKAPIDVEWPDKVEKIYNGDQYFDMRLKYLGGLVGDDGNNPNLEFRVRVVADGKDVGVHQVKDIEFYTGGIDMNNYQLKGNTPTEAEIVSYDSMFPENSAKPGNLSNIIMPKETKACEPAGTVSMDSTQMTQGEQVLKDIFDNILNKAPLNEDNVDIQKGPEKETLDTAINIAQAVKRGAYINMYVSAESKENSENIPSVQQIQNSLAAGDQVVQSVEVKVSAVSVEQNKLICQLGELVNLGQKLSFTVDLDDSAKGGQFAVARVVDGQVDYLSEHYVEYNQETNQLSFKADRGGIYTVVQVA